MNVHIFICPYLFVRIDTDMCTNMLVRVRFKPAHTWVSRSHELFRDHKCLRISTVFIAVFPGSPL